MTIFADTLRKYLESKNTTIYNIAKISGVERTMIQHMKAGKRLPSNVSDVQALAKAMMLNLSETEELIRSYNITHMGEENYFRREHVGKIISGFYDMNTASKLILPKGSQDTLEMNETLKEIIGRSNINRIVKALLEMEANKKGGHVKLMVQPEYTYLFDCLTSIDFSTNNTLVEAIIVFDKNEGNRSTLYNLNVLEKLVPTLFQCDIFHPYFIYENVDSLFNKNSFMPYKIITSDYILGISYEHDKALLYNDASMSKLMNETFKKQLSIATPICQTFHPTPEEYLASTFTQEIIKPEEKKDGTEGKFTSFSTSPAFQASVPKIFCWTDSIQTSSRLRWWKLSKTILLKFVRSTRISLSHLRSMASTCLWKQDVLLRFPTSCIPISHRHNA